MISFRNVHRYELIGLDVLVVKSSNNTFVGLQGKVVDETRNMVKIASAGNIKMVPKMHSIFRFINSAGSVFDVDGSVLLAAPEKRINLPIRK